MNKELLLRVKAHILEEPRRLDMSLWVQVAEPGLQVYNGFESGIEGGACMLKEPEVPPCGTVACIAGWACLLSGDDAPFSFESAGRQALDIDWLIGGELFYPKQWPDHRDYEEYRTCGSAERRAQVVARVIDAFIVKHEGSAK